MQKAQGFRHELKYGIDPFSYLVLRQRLSTVMRRDSHAGTDGRYQIVSLYFDNCCDKALREKQDGINRREKFRLRRYNDDCSALFLEKKQKVNGLCLKTGCRIPQDVCIRLLLGEPDWLPPDGHPLLQELDFQMKSQLLRPKTLVRYLREPYVYEAGNVRITFDMALQSGLADIGFLDPKAVFVPAIEPGRMVLEVKYDAFLPSFIADALQIGHIRTGAFSKYAVCRKFE